METLFKILLTSISIYAYLKKQELLFLILTLIILYTIIELLVALKSSKNTLKSKIFNSNFNETGNPLCFFNILVKTEKVEKFIKEYNKKNFDNKIDLELFALRAMGSSLDKDKSYGNIAFENFTNLESVDITMVKSYKGKEILHCVRNCNGKKISDINDEIKKKKNKLIQEFEKKQLFFDSYSKYLPSFLIKLYLDFLNFFSYSLFIDFFGYEKNHYGKGFFFPSLNKGSLENLYLPLSMRLNSCVAVFMNDIKEIPCIKKNGDFGVERILELSMTGDHKHADGSNLISLVPNFKKVFENPEEYI